ncbi:MAG: 50S ribosomal protein L6, partial [Bradyrhizobium sp.]|uniref:50S ribosomal protein L6 n=1 Tax=Bradyrhizobium sp. TaxID=376 RepID=UPI003C7D31F8
MSRIGKRPVAVPSGVTAAVDGQTVKVKGPKGQLQFIVHDDVEVKFENGQVTVAPRSETKRARSLYGTARA